MSQFSLFFPQAPPLPNRPSSLQGTSAPAPPRPPSRGILKGRGKSAEGGSGSGASSASASAANRKLSSELLDDPSVLLKNTQANEAITAYSYGSSSSSRDGGVQKDQESKNPALWPGLVIILVVFSIGIL